MRRFREVLQFARETSRVCSVVHSQEDAASRRRILRNRIVTGWTSCPDASNVNHFVWPYFFQNTVQAAPARPLLRDESDGCRPALPRFFQSFGDMEQRLATKPY